MAATGGLLTRDVSLDSLKAAFQRFYAWELDECRAMLPPAAVVWLLGRGARRALLKADEPDLVLPAESGLREIRISGAEIAASSLDAALARRGLARKSIAITLEMPAATFLTRQFDAPIAALGHLPQMLNAEIERRTPFRSDDLLRGCHVETLRGAGKAKISMALLRRDLIAPALEPSGLLLGDLATIRAAAGPDGSVPPPIRVQAANAPDVRFRLIALTMLALAAFLVAAGVGATLWRQSREADELDARIADLTTRAAHVRQMADSAAKESRLLSILRETRQKNPPLTALWEEVSRLIPDDAYLTDFHLSETKNGERSIDMSGYARSAVGLPLLFDQSKFFIEANLTAPITSDPREKRESFSLRLKTRAPEAAESATTASARAPRAEITP